MKGKNPNHTAYNEVDTSKYEKYRKIFNRTVSVISRFYENPNIPEEAKNYNYLTDVKIDTSRSTGCGVILFIRYIDKKYPYPVDICTRWGTIMCFYPILKQFDLRKKDPTVLLPDYRKLLREINFESSWKASQPGFRLRVYTAYKSEYLYLTSMNSLGYDQAHNGKKDEELIKEWNYFVSHYLEKKRGKNGKDEFPGRFRKLCHN